MKDTDKLITEFRHAVEALLLEVRKQNKLAFSVEEAAEALGVHRDTVQQLIDSGQLRARCVAGRKRRTFRVSRKALDAFMEAGGPNWEARL
jgi:excisionase family DNA binding protein